MYLGYQNNKIKFYTEAPLNQVIYNIDRTEETNDEYVLFGDEYVLKASPELLQQKKEDKYQEALEQANIFINTEAVYQFDSINSIEATGDNIGKFTAYLVGLQSGTLQEVTWVSKEDNVLTLNVEDVTTILLGLGQVQSDIWSNQFLTYKTAIEEASTVEEVEAITTSYHNPE